jgi:hypothetical protein
MVVVNQAHYGGLVVGRLDFVFEKNRRSSRKLSKNNNQSL